MLGLNPVVKRSEQSVFVGLGWRSLHLKIRVANEVTRLLLYISITDTKTFHHPTSIILIKREIYGCDVEGKLIPKCNKFKKMMDLGLQLY